MSGKYPTPRGPSANAAKKKYNKRNYDTLCIAVKKGEKEKIQSCAISAGESVNCYIKNAVQERMKKEKNDGH